jgi:hypothetical protein
MQRAGTGPLARAPGPGPRARTGTVTAAASLDSDRAAVRARTPGLPLSAAPLTRILDPGPGGLRVRQAGWAGQGS